MSTTARKQHCDWREDLQASRDLDPRTKDGFGFLLGWYESWRIGRGMAAGVESGRLFWREAVMSKERAPWQKQHWTEAMRWILKWRCNQGCCRPWLVREACEKTLTPG